MSRVLGAEKAWLSFIPPQFPTLVDELPSGHGWIHEIKYEGFRLQLLIDRESAWALSSTGLDWSDRFNSITQAASRLRCRAAVIDGQAVAQSESEIVDGESVGTDKSFVLIAFDLLHLDGKDLRRLPLVDRRAKLAELLAGPDGPILFSEAFIGEGAVLLKVAEEMGLEGVVSKRALSTYRSGRSRAWLQAECLVESELTLIGFDEDGEGVPIALLAKDGPTGLAYAGDAILTMDMKARVGRLRRCGSAPVAAAGHEKATWLEPTLKLRIRHLRDNGREIRRASVVGLAHLDRVEDP